MLANIIIVIITDKEFQDALFKAKGTYNGNNQREKGSPDCRYDLQFGKGDRA
jgi:hypothetical protein